VPHPSPPDSTEPTRSLLSLLLCQRCDHTILLISGRPGVREGQEGGSSRGKSRKAWPSPRTQSQAGSVRHLAGPPPFGLHVPMCRIGSNESGHQLQRGGTKVHTWHQWPVTRGKTPSTCFYCKRWCPGLQKHRYSLTGGSTWPLLQLKLWTAADRGQPALRAGWGPESKVLARGTHPPAARWRALPDTWQGTRCPPAAHTAKQP